MSDNAKILQLTPPTPSTKKRPPDSPEIKEARIKEIKDLLRIGGTLSCAVDDLGYIVQDYEEIRIEEAVSGMGKALYNIFEEIEINLTYLK